MGCNTHLLPGRKVLPELTRGAAVPRYRSARPVLPSLGRIGPAAPYTTLARRRKPVRRGRDCAPTPTAPQRRQGHSSAPLMYGTIIEIVITEGDCKRLAGTRLAVTEDETVIPLAREEEATIRCLKSGHGHRPISYRRRSSAVWGPVTALG